MIPAAEFFYKEFQRNRSELAVYRFKTTSCALCGTLYTKVLGVIENNASAAVERLLNFVKSSAI